MATNNNHLMPIKKTKKSSYKPLSKLNEDNLTELKRVDKPEYTNRVFFYNHASKARLVHNVNTWFKHHEHSMKLISRHQRTLCKVLVRVQQDRHRARRQMYLRQQKEMRENMVKMEQELLARRVIQRFRRNAFDKMSSRGMGSLSLSGKSLEAQRLRFERSSGEDEEEDEEEQNKDANASEQEGEAANSQNPSPNIMLGTVVNYAANVSNNQAHSATEDTTANGVESDETEIVSDVARSVSDDSKATEGDQKPRSLRNSGPLTPTISVRTAKHRSTKLSVISRETILDAIPEVASPAPSMHSHSPTENPFFGAPRGSNTRYFNKRGGSANEDVEEEEEEEVDDLQVGDTFSTLNSRVMEVNKRSEHFSGVTRTRKIAYAHLPPLTPMRMYLETPSSSVDMLSRTPLNLQATSATTEKHPSEQSSLNPHRTLPSISVVDQQTGSEQVSHQQTHHSLDNPARSLDSRTVPTRDQAITDAAVLLSMNSTSEDEAEKEESSSGGKAGGKPKSLAARIRQERKGLDKRRSDRLDQEPLTQYYRSSRGILQPLIARPVRRHWGLPDGRRQYQQNKLLREEHRKELDRRGIIDKFFTDMVTRKIGQPRTAQDAQSDPEEGMETNHLQKLLSRMRNQSQVAAAATAVDTTDKNSMEQLAKCQYLRAYDWDTRDRQKEGEKVGHGDEAVEKMSSWATAEDSLKAGSLALRLTR